MKGAALDKIHRALLTAARSSKASGDLAAGEAIACLRSLASKISRNLSANIRAGILTPHDIDHDAAIECLLQSCGWDKLNENARGFLDIPPQTWSRFTEPQITRGWAYFLGERFRVERCQAAFNAAWCGRVGQIPVIVEVEDVVAEAGRMDLLITAEDSAGVKHAICIEAKFGHSLGLTQLRKYETDLRMNHKVGDASRRAMLVVASAYRPDIVNTLLRTDEWEFCSWRDWLIRYANALDPRFDDDTFRSFRHTVLHRSKEEFLG